MGYLNKVSGTSALCGGKLEATEVWWAREEAIRLRDIQIVMKNMNQGLGKEAALGLRQGPRTASTGSVNEGTRRKMVSDYLDVQESQILWCLLNGTREE